MPMKSPPNSRAGGSACAMVTQRIIDATPNAAINFTLHIEQYGAGIRNAPRLGNRGASWYEKMESRRVRRPTMKISMFHLMPYRDLPDDFAQKYHSVWVDPPYTELADSVKVGQYYNWTLDELIHAADKGIDGICVNEHHQNAYGFMPNPDLMGSILARATNGTDVAVVQMGATLPTSNPPIRIAEEYSMIDCISGG